MRKRILLCLLVLCLAFLRPFCVYAAPLDVNAQASLTLHYQKDGTVFPDLQIDIYRVAEAFSDGTFALVEPYSSYPVNIHDITQQAQWKHIATTLGAYIAAKETAPDRQMLTDTEGIARFEELDTGLYLVSEVIGENELGTYVFNQFMVYVPTPQADGSFAYQVEAKPKCTNFVPKTQYTVTKLWQDNQSTRPKEVTVEIYKDSVLQETKILNAENNWSYSWSVSGEDHGKWTVAEPYVPAGYQVTIRENGGVFSVINTGQVELGDPPQTGDSFIPLPWILIMCFSGIMLVILGLYSRRRR